MELLGEIEKPASIDSLPFLMEFVENQIGIMSFSEEKKKNICLAVEEALKNIFYHGRALEGTNINITFKLDNFGRFQIVITDRGAPFNMLLEEVIWDEDKSKDKDTPQISTKNIKRAIKDIEYKRIEQMNVLTFTIPNL